MSKKIVSIKEKFVEKIFSNIIFDKKNLVEKNFDKKKSFKKNFIYQKEI